MKSLHMYIAFRVNISHTGDPMTHVVFPCGISQKITKSYSYHHEQQQMIYFTLKLSKITKSYHHMSAKLVPCRLMLVAFCYLA